MNSIEYNYYSGNYETYTQYNEDKEYFERHYIKAMILVNQNEKLSFAYFVPAEEFIQEAANGDFNEYDGHGYWIDWDGNEICDISWEIGATMPKNAVFVAWYNK